MAESPQLTLEQALQSADVRQGEVSGFWKFLGRDQDLLYFEMRAWDGNTYVLELTADHFQEQPLLGRFVDPGNRKCTSEAWPSGNNTFGEWFKWQPENLFICWPGDRGGIQRHSEWRAQRYWNKSPNPLHQYLEFIRQCLTIRGRGYQPRKQPLRAA